MTRRGPGEPGPAAVAGTANSNQHRTAALYDRVEAARQYWLAAADQVHGRDDLARWRIRGAQCLELRADLLDAVAWVPPGPMHGPPAPRYSTALVDAEVEKRARGAMEIAA